MNNSNNFSWGFQNCKFSQPRTHSVDAQLLPTQPTYHLRFRLFGQSWHVEGVCLIKKSRSVLLLELKKLSFWESPVKIRDVAGTPTIQPFKKLAIVWLLWKVCPVCKMPTGFHNDIATLTPPADFVCETESCSEALSWVLRCQIVFSILATMSQSPLLNECTAMNESYFSLCSLIASLCLTIAPCNDVLNAHRSVRSIFA